MAVLKGVDLSVHNGTVDMAKAKADGISFVMLRGGYGDLLSYPRQKDGRFESNFANAKSAGINVGVYHYLYAENVEAAKREAEGFVQLLKGKKLEYPVALDIEEAGQYAKSSETIGNIIVAFISVLEKAGYYCFLYSYEAFLNKVPASVRSKYDLWVANISKSPALAYGMHQYSFTGKINGISGAVDMNKTEKDYPTIMKNGGFNGFEKVSGKPELESGSKCYKQGDNTPGSYNLKLLLMLDGENLDDNGIIGEGTVKAINSRLNKWGYAQTGVAGEKFAKKLYKSVFDKM